MALRVRAAGSGDLAAMADLLTLLFCIEADFTPDRERQLRGLALLLNRPATARLFVAEQAGAVVGMCSVQVLISTAQGGEVGLVEDVVVRPELRGSGVGRALLSAVEGWARERGLSRLQLLADRENGPALAFYRRLGWEPTQLMAWRRLFGQEVGEGAG